MKERAGIPSRIFNGIYARTSENLFFIALHCGTTNAQKISMSICQQPSFGTQQRNKMQGLDDREHDINQLRPHRKSLTRCADNEIIHACTNTRLRLIRQSFGKIMRTE